MVTIVTDLNNARGGRIRVALKRASGPVREGDVVSLEDVSEAETAVLGRIESIDEREIASVQIIGRPSGGLMLMSTALAGVFRENAVVPLGIDTHHIPQNDVLVS